MVTPRATSAGPADAGVESLGGDSAPEIARACPSLQRLSLTGPAAGRAAAALVGRLPATAARTLALRATADPAPPPAREKSTDGLVTTARTLKVTLVIDGASLSDPVVPDGQGRVSLVVDVAGRVLRASLSAKSIRRASSAIDAAGGPGAVAVVLSGRLEPDNRVADAGIAVQPRSPKPPPSESAT